MWNIPGMTGQELQLRCKESLAALGIQSNKDFKAHLRQIFETSSHQVQALEAIYKTVLPDWDRIVAVEAYPEAGHQLWCFICGLFVSFDKEHHPEALQWRSLAE